jgi:hypothetical protein
MVACCFDSNCQFTAALHKADPFLKPGAVRLL